MTLEELGKLNSLRHVARKYRQALEEIPPPGCGCHPALLGVATLGRMAGISAEQVFEDILLNIPSGERNVSDREIQDAVNKAFLENRAAPFQSRPRPAIKPDYLQTLIQRGRQYGEADMTAASPLPIPEAPAEQALLILRTLFKPADFIFAGARTGWEVMRAKELHSRIKTCGTVSCPHIVPNPFTGQKHQNKSDKPSYRCDAAIKEFRFSVVEFDGLPRADQLAFWAAIPLPVAALIDSGGKSIHGWLAVYGIDTVEQWTQTIRNGLYGQRLVPLGVDPACKNEARLSRMPGHYRTEKNLYQRLLYLNPKPQSAPILCR